MAREFGRKDRVADYLRQELARFIQNEIRDPRIGMVSVNEVEVSRDLAYAKVFVSFMGKDTEKDAHDELEVLNKASGFLRTLLAREARMRSIPKLRFVYDGGVVRGRKLSDLIDRALADDASRHPEQGGSDGEGSTD